MPRFLFTGLSCFALVACGGSGGGINRPAGGLPVTPTPEEVASRLSVVSGPVGPRGAASQTLTETSQIVSVFQLAGIRTDVSTDEMDNIVQTEVVRTENERDILFRPEDDLGIVQFDEEGAVALRELTEREGRLVRSEGDDVTVSRYSYYRAGVADDPETADDDESVPDAAYFVEIDGFGGMMEYTALALWHIGASEALSGQVDAEELAQLQIGTGVFGLVTPEADVPVSGSALYRGAVAGFYRTGETRLLDTGLTVEDPRDSGAASLPLVIEAGPRSYFVDGDFQLTAHFVTDQLDGVFRVGAYQPGLGLTPLPLGGAVEDESFSSWLARGGQPHADPIGTPLRPGITTRPAVAEYIGVPVEPLFDAAGLPILDTNGFPVMGAPPTVAESDDAEVRTIDSRESVVVAEGETRNRDLVLRLASLPSVLQGVFLNGQIDGNGFSADVAAGGTPVVESTGVFEPLAADGVAGRVQGGFYGPSAEEVAGSGSLGRLLSEAGTEDGGELLFSFQGRQLSLINDDSVELAPELRTELEQLATLNDIADIYVERVMAEFRDGMLVYQQDADREALVELQAQFRLDPTIVTDLGRLQTIDSRFELPPPASGG